MTTANKQVLAARSKTGEQDVPRIVAWQPVGEFGSALDTIRITLSTGQDCLLHFYRTRPPRASFEWHAVSCDAASANVQPAPQFLAFPGELIAFTLQAQVWMLERAFEEEIQYAWHPEFVCFASVTEPDAACDIVLLSELLDRLRDFANDLGPKGKRGKKFAKTYYRLSNGFTGSCSRGCR